jgi:hypothetical protein
MADKIDVLFERIHASEVDSKQWLSAIFDLIDNNQSKRIVPFLFYESKRYDIKELSGTLLYAAGEYSVEQCIEECDFLMYALINSNKEVALTVDSIFQKMQPYYDRLSTDWIKIKVDEMKLLIDNSHPNVGYITDVYDYLIGYLNDHGLE